MRLYKVWMKTFAAVKELNGALRNSMFRGRREPKLCFDFSPRAVLQRHDFLGK